MRSSVYHTLVGYCVETAERKIAAQWQLRQIRNFRIGPSLLNRIGTSDSNSSRILKLHRSITFHLFYLRLFPLLLNNIQCNTVHWSMTARGWISTIIRECHIASGGLSATAGLLVFISTSPVEQVKPRSPTVIHQRTTRRLRHVHVHKY